MTPEETKRLLDRLARIEGQVRGLRNMLEDQRCTIVSRLKRA